MGLMSSKLKKNPHPKSNRSKKSKNCSVSRPSYQELNETIFSGTTSTTSILNNLMMCIQFFENFEEDIHQIKESLASSYENKYNEILPFQKHILYPDVLQEHISQNIDFTSKRQTEDLVIEMLHPVRIYVVHDNIEITEQYSPEYSSLNNGITYNMMVKPSKHYGYVTLQLLDGMPYSMRSSRKEENIKPFSTIDDDEMYNGDDESLDDRNSNMTPLHQIRRGGLQTSSISRTRSLPNLHEKKIYEDSSISNKGTYGSRFNRDIKTESVYGHASSMENESHSKMTWMKSELNIKSQNYQHYHRPNVTKLTLQKDHWLASSLSSGYRSGICDSSSEYTLRSYPTLPKSKIQVADHSEAELKEICPDAKLPSQCFKKVTIDSKGKFYRSKYQKRPQNSKQLRCLIADRQNDRHVLYTSSKKFMEYFVYFFKNQLIEPLGFKEIDLNEYNKESVIYADKITYTPRLRKIVSYEISPTMRLQWPKIVVLERDRKGWPKKCDIDKVKDFGCYVIPENSLPYESCGNDVMPRVDENIDHEIEWQLVFPAAERYLETCMTRSQVHVYLIALMLHKTFLQPNQQKMMYRRLTTSHIRNKLFWLIEEDGLPSKCSDNQTGEYLLRLLNSLNDCLSKTELPDYFLPNKNMLNKVSSHSWLYSQKQLKRIIDNPVMYVFHAMENIHYRHKFFPSLNFAKLYNILTMNQVNEANPTSNMRLSLRINESNERVRESPNEWWDKEKETTSQNNGASTYSSRTLINPHEEADSIVEIKARCAKNLDRQRQGELLDFFIDHFINMAECCHKYRAKEQKNTYLNQANLLLTDLSKMATYENNVTTYRQKISYLKDRPIVRSQNEPPETPKRNAAEPPVFSSNLKDRYTQPGAAEISHLPKNEQSQSSQKDYADEVTKTTAPKERLANEESVQTDVASAITSEKDVPCTSRELQRNVAKMSKNHDNATTSDAMRNVISLSDNLNDVTYTYV